MGDNRRRAAVGQEERVRKVRFVGGVAGRVVAGVVAVAGLSLAGAGSAVADDTEVVEGGSFPTDRTGLAYSACDRFGAPADAPVLRVNTGPEGQSHGERTAGLLPQGRGTAAGPVVVLDSMGTGIASTEVHTEQGGQGVSWAWVRSPDATAGQAWLGRADVTTSSGWSVVDTAALPYDWTLVDLATMRSVETAPSATLGRFTRDHGDGAGYVFTGLGCDGVESHLDAVRAGAAGDVTTYDIEGLALTTTIAASETRVRRGDRVRLTASVVDALGRVTGDLVRLQQRTGDGGWIDVGKVVEPGLDGIARVRVGPDRTTSYRWWRPASEYADAGHSVAVEVRVRR